MKSSTTPDFWKTFSVLPPTIKTRARIVFRLWKHKHRHPSLQFKKTGNLWSVRIGGGYRALAIDEDETYHWFWIGPHDEYERLINLK